ncbi:MAG: NAD(P)H-dependent oxidoreductase [Candidatus Gracilibacteria bacterium]|nr:NAD(P)H-dependent oxidoreductase [Candidatus Gracilibacteria bacterium]
MNTLIITAHPSTKGFTHQLAAIYKELSETEGRQVEILDLYTTNLKQDFLRFEDMKEMKTLDETTRKMQEKVDWAEELVFIFPVWWADAPAILKNWIDCNFTAGFAFKYENGKPKGLLAGKTARIFATSGAPGFVYSLFPVNYRILWGMMRLGFCGIKTMSIKVFGKMEELNNDQKKSMLDKEMKKIFG